MGKKKLASGSHRSVSGPPETPVELPDDPEFQAQLEKLLKQHDERQKLRTQIPRLLPDDRPRYVFVDESSNRDIGRMVRVSNGFEETGGTILQQVSESLYIVRIGDAKYPVHESHCAWIPLEE